MQGWRLWVTGALALCGVFEGDSWSVPESLKIRVLPFPDLRPRPEMCTVNDFDGCFRSRTLLRNAARGRDEGRAGEREWSEHFDVISGNRKDAPFLPGVTLAGLSGPTNRARDGQGSDDNLPNNTTHVLGVGRSMTNTKDGNAIQSERSNTSVDSQRLEEIRRPS